MILIAYSRVQIRGKEPCAELIRRQALRVASPPETGSNVKP